MIADGRQDLGFRVQGSGFRVQEADSSERRGRDPRPLAGVARESASAPGSATDPGGV